jgi:hypothetical protein
MVHAVGVLEGSYMDESTFRRIPARYEDEGQTWVPDATTISEQYGPQGWEATSGEPVAVEGVPDTFEWVLRRSQPDEGPRLHG